MKKRSIIANYFYNLSYQVLTLLVPLITMPYISRVLGTENVGLFNFFQSVVSYFVLLGCVGMNIYGQREVAFCKNNRSRRTRVFCELMIIRFVTITFSTILYYLVIIRNSTGYSRYYIILLIELLAAFFDISWFFQGVEDFKLQAIRNFITKILGLITIFAFVKTEQDLDIYILFYALTIMIGNISMWFSLPKYLGRTNIQLFGILKHLGPILIMFLPQIATSVYAYLDKIMIRIFLEGMQGYTEVGYYSQAEKITKIVLMVVTSLGLVMLSRVANRFSAGDIKAVNDYIKKSFKFLFIIAYPATFGLMAISNDMIIWFLGEDYARSAPCMMLISPIILLIGISNIIGTQYLLPTNRMKEYTVSVSCGLVVNVVFNSILISRFGCFGAAVSTVLAELAVTAVQFRFVRKEFSPKILLDGWRCFFASLIMGASVYLISDFTPPTFTSTLIQVSVGVVIYVVMLLILKEPFIYTLLGKVSKKLRIK